MTDVSPAEQALWDVWALLGFDTDGDPTPAATIAGGGRAAFYEMIKRDVAEHLVDDREAEAEAWDEGYSARAEVQWLDGPKYRVNPYRDGGTS